MVRAEDWRRDSALWIHLSFVSYWTSLPKGGLGPLIPAFFLTLFFVSVFLLWFFVCLFGGFLLFSFLSKLVQKEKKKKDLFLARWPPKEQALNLYFKFPGSARWRLVQFSFLLIRNFYTVHMQLNPSLQEGIALMLQWDVNRSKDSSEFLVTRQRGWPKSFDKKEF